MEEDEQVGLDGIFRRSVDGPESAVHGGQVRFRVGHVALDRLQRQVRCFHLDRGCSAFSPRRTAKSSLSFAPRTALDGRPSRQNGAPASLHQAHEAYRHRKDHRKPIFASSSLARLHSSDRLQSSQLSYRLAARELGVSVHDAKQYALSLSPDSREVSSPSTLSLIIASFHPACRILAAYLASDPAKERGVTATYLLSGYLKQDSAANGKGADAMDIDGLDATQSSQNGARGDEEALAEVVKTKTMMIVQQDELEGKSGGLLYRARGTRELTKFRLNAAKTALFSPAPTSHVYALVPTRLTSLALLSASALSLIRPEVREQKWKPAPESAPAYGGIVHPDGERKVPQGKHKAPPMPAAAPKAGPSGTSKPAKKDEAAAAAASKPVKGKGKGKEKESASSAAASKGKAKKEEPKIRPIGQLGGLFAKKFDDSTTKKKKDKKKADSDDSDADGRDDDDEDEEVVKPKKSIPAKRKSTSPAVSRKKPAPAAAAPPQKATAAPAKKTPEIIMDNDDDEFGAWDMDEEALLEAERAAEESIKAKAQARAAGMSRGNSSTSTSKEASEPRKGETKAERQKRELEVCATFFEFLRFGGPALLTRRQTARPLQEMMKSDDMEIDEKKPLRAPSRELNLFFSPLSTRDLRYIDSVRPFAQSRALLPPRLLPPTSLLPRRKKPPPRLLRRASDRSSKRADGSLGKLVCRLATEKAVVWVLCMSYNRYVMLCRGSTERRRVSRAMQGRSDAKDVNERDVRTAEEVVMVCRREKCLLKKKIVETGNRRR